MSTKVSINTLRVLTLFKLSGLRLQGSTVVYSTVVRKERSPESDILFIEKVLHELRSKSVKLRRTPLKQQILPVVLIMTS